MIDGVLYGTRHSGHWLYEPPPELLEAGTQEYDDQIELEMEEEPFSFGV